MLYYMSGSKWSVYILYNIILQCEYIYIYIAITVYRYTFGGEHQLHLLCPCPNLANNPR